MCNDKNHLIKSAAVLRLAETGNAVEAVEQAEELASLLKEKGYFLGNNNSSNSEKRKKAGSKKEKKIEIPDIRPFDMLEGQTYKSYLQEFCQKHEWDLPVYEVESNGSGFKAKVSIIYWDDDLESIWLTSNSKKEAEKKAAQHMVAVVIPEYEKSV